MILLAVVGNLRVTQCSKCSRIYAAGTPRGIQIIARHPLWCIKRKAEDRRAWLRMNNVTLGWKRE